MIPKQAQTLAAYNQWMNQKLYAIAAKIPDQDRKRDCGVFFKSIHGTLNHGLLADKIWLSRFMDSPFTATRLDTELHRDFADLRSDRQTTDQVIIGWASGLSEEKLQGTLRYTRVTVAETRDYSYWFAVTHFFNHQTHHRGQLTAILAQLGYDYGVTDLIAMPPGDHPAKSITLN